MWVHSTLLWLACLASAVMSAALVTEYDNALFLQRSVERAKKIIPDATSFIDSPGDRKKATVLLHDVGAVKTLAKLQGKSIKSGKFNTSDCTELSSLWTSLSNHVIEASPLLSVVGTNPNLASWNGQMTNSLKRDMGINILNIRMVFDRNGNPFFEPLLQQLQTRCSDMTEDINTAADNVVLALDEVLKNY